MHQLLLSQKWSCFCKRLRSDDYGDLYADEFELVKICLQNLKYQLCWFCLEGGLIMLVKCVPDVQFLIVSVQADIGFSHIGSKEDIWYNLNTSGKTPEVGVVHTACQV